MTSKQYKALKKVYWAERFNKKIECKTIYKMCNKHMNPSIPYPLNQYLTVESYQDKDYETISTGYVSINDMGIEYVEERKRRFWSFLLPYAITTLIAVLSLATTIVQIFRG